MLWLILFFSFCGLIWFRQWQWQQLTSSIPTLPGTLPIIGIAHQILGSTERLWNTLEKWISYINTLDGIAKLWTGPFLIIVVTDAKLALALLNSYSQKHHFYSFSVSWLGQGLVTSSGSTWKRHRKLLSPAFSQHVIDEFLQIFNQQSVILVETLKQKANEGEFDHTQFISEIALETVCQTAIGLPPGSKTVVNQDYRRAISRLLEIYAIRLKTIWLYPNFMYDRTFTKKEETDAINILKGMSEKVIAATKNSGIVESSKQKYQSDNKPHRPIKPFLRLLMDLNKNGQLTEAETREETDTIIAAGYDTTSTTLLILLVIIGSHPEVQDRVYHEILKVFPKSSKHITKEGLSALVYLEAVIKETMRLYPTIPMIARTADQNLKFGDLIIPNGTGIFVPIYGVNRNKKYWGNNADDFIPERWLQSSTLPDHPAAFTSFSLGRRTCIGKLYAIMSLKTSLVHVLRKYRVKADHTKLKFKYEFILKPTSGHFISIELR